MPFQGISLNERQGWIQAMHLPELGWISFWISCFPRVTGLLFQALLQPQSFVNTWMFTVFWLSGSLHPPTVMIFSHFITHHSKLIACSFLSVLVLYWYYFKLNSWPLVWNWKMWSRSKRVCWHQSVSTQSLSDSSLSFGYILISTDVSTALICLWQFS